MSLNKARYPVSIFRSKLLFCSTTIESKCHSSNKSRPRPSWSVPNGYDTSITVHNSATKTKVPLILRKPHYASWYMCGPTVYDSAHIGHACSYVKFDIIRRILTNYFNINVVMVMGITDVDDKIIRRAAEQKQDITTLTRHYETDFLEDMASLNVEPATVTTRVSDFIPQIIHFVQQIVDKGQGYVMDDGSVYFDTARFSGYGKLFPASEVTENPGGGKRSSLDFALWKGSKPGEPWWESPWGSGKGRPGWHIECSTMASAVLGSSVDVHSGGADLMFPHHENEEAQSCVRHGTDQWVNYWLHAGHLHVRGDVKMSKSLKNTVAIRHFLRTHSANQFRVFCLLSRYRNGVEFSDSSMDNAVAICKKMESFLGDADAYVRGLWGRGAVDEPALLQALTATQAQLTASLANDFDTPQAVAALLDLISVANRMLRSEAVAEPSPAPVAAVANYLRSTMGKLGASFTDTQARESRSQMAQVRNVLDSVVQFRTDVRTSALASRDTGLLERCDQVRDQLASAGILVKDHGKQSSWSYASQEREQEQR